ncbi:uncharacterized protein FOMMEDRAFT_152697 [Fomitiporia mediterranea MF3/22]|uniref:uncharacterized protein n=1 Tax=Fomitiporia mediterranea (strain MF3/22) TaxID=694068 RepID=UPI00044089B8|nr:uncharacterized protein FOMMEDRAFT_152697 [Fomitiporia mediterranea MF3/22]EJD05396.1 hypothetical protein FOMMEDRAFT_152697 [Fomitiporia mediterranea MF3/22]
MSTFNNAVFSADSDDEHDPDFVPNEHSSSSDEETTKTAAAPESDPVNKEAETAAQKEARASLWASFQSSVSGTNGEGSGASTPPVKKARLVKVEKKYRFAGEEVSEVVEVPEDSEDAKKWPLWRQPSQDAERANEAEHKATPPDNMAIQPSLESASRASGPSGPTSIAESSSRSSTPVTARPKPGPRKAKTVLTPMPSAKPKKLTTLEKSAMDWRAHVASEGEQGESSTKVQNGGENLADELEKNRRSGGYLEKVAFLERVGSRREELFDESRKKRRKG